MDKFSKKYMDKFPKKIYGQIKLAPHWLAGWLAGSSHKSFLLDERKSEVYVYDIYLLK